MPYKVLTLGINNLFLPMWEVTAVAYLKISAKYNGESR